ncbi:secretion-regulating guanine nucleotide exchange factor isoform X3 [Neolamprologus brichardi]|uniref:secretion-regulating guanine nucleotide exchange factor isoform X3 n=1 Tax=Neolamprologus brichardi TaxID=32507 RepID=UPI001643D5A5|nr:secretion-regulating guanine nucleotide exchange factor isoform X3 [Neolamprologus brichardi]
METHARLEFCLHSWGANSYGQLSQGHVEDQASPRLSNIAALQNRPVRAVSGGGGHSVVITESGQVFVCGQNNRGQLGLGHSADIATLQHCPILNQRVTDIACGWDFTLLLTGSGCVYQWGTGLFSYAKRALSPHAVPSHFNSKVPCLVPGLDQRISHRVTAGSAHCVCLTGDGDLFLWGSNKHGQLTTTEPFLSSPTLLKRSLLDGEKVINVWSGWTHNVAQTESGRVFTWGRGNYGQLGRQISASEDTEQQPAGPAAQGGTQEVGLPAEVENLCGATQICCGSEHNLATVGGSLFSWGWNEHGMCGDGLQADVFHPQLVPGLRPVLIGCGAGHSMAVCAATTGTEKNSAPLE